MDKKLLYFSFAYAVLGMLSGAVYREFGKFVGYTGDTNISHLYFFYYISLASLSYALTYHK